MNNVSGKPGLFRKRDIGDISDIDWLHEESDCFFADVEIQCEKKHHQNIENSINYA